jgi:F-type H+-transporting ATPase subunit epsilon
MKSFWLEINLPDKELFGGEVIALNLPAEDGKLGILARHAPLLSLLAKGELRYKLPDQSEKTLALESGIIKFDKNRAQVFIG